MWRHTVVCGGKYDTDLMAHVTAESNSERIFKVGQHFRVLSISILKSLSSSTVHIVLDPNT